MTSINSVINAFTKCFDLVGAYHSWAANKVVKEHFLSAQLKSAKALKLYLCPDNGILMIEVDDVRVLSKNNLDRRFLLELFYVVTKENYYLVDGYRVQSAHYNSDITDETGTFSVFTLPLTNAQ